MRKKIKFGQDGFTLPEIMLSMAMLGIIAVAGMQVASNISSNENYLRAQSEISKKVGQLENILGSKKSCVMMLKGISSGTKLSELAITRPGDGSRNIILKEGQSYGEYFLENGIGNENASIFLKKSSISANTLELVLNFRTKKKALLSPSDSNSTVTKTISFMATEGAAGIVDCGILVGATNLSAAEKACHSLGDMATWTGNSCELVSFECPYGQVMENLEQLGEPKCVSLKSKILLSDIFEMTPKNCTNKPDYSFFVNSQGKVEIRCEGSYTPPVQHRYVEIVCYPRNGGYSWSDWSACVNGKMSRTVIGCNNPSPNRCGNPCSGSTYEETTCSTTGGNSGGSNGNNGSGGATDPGPTCVSDCAAKVAETCAGYQATDQCGNSCGEGTKACTCMGGPVNGGWSGWGAWGACQNGSQSRSRTCTNPSPSCNGAPCSGSTTESQSCACVPAQSCSSIAANVCSDRSAGSDSCGTSCGSGTKTCSCTPSESCSSIASNICSDQSAGSDSCGNSCGSGTKSCPPQGGDGGCGPDFGRIIWWTADNTVSCCGQGWVPNGHVGCCRNPNTGQSVCI